MPGAVRRLHRNQETYATPVPRLQFPIYKTKKSDFLIFLIHSSSEGLWFQNQCVKGRGIVEKTHALKLENQFKPQLLLCNLGPNQLTSLNLHFSLIQQIFTEHFKKKNLFIYLFVCFWLCWVFVSVRGLSLVAASGGHSSSRCTDLSLSRPLLLRYWALFMCHIVRTHQWTRPDLCHHGTHCLLKTPWMQVMETDSSQLIQNQNAL